jgi:glycine betaine/proline transport system ATP-binding protein
MTSLAPFNFEIGPGNAPTAAAVDARPALIEVQDVSKVFGDRGAEALAMLDAGEERAAVLARTGTAVGLNHVSFDVAEGEILVVMGLSGSGKSTMLRCLNRLIEPSSGMIRVRGADVTAMPPGALREFRRETFGMVFQHFALFPHRTILGNVEFGLEVQGMAKPARRDSAMRAIELVGLKGWDARYPSELSGGMKQRAGLARALAADAAVLLMDEAFSALDPLIRRDMQQELVELQRRLRKTIVFVSHDLDEAIALGGRIVLMKDGAIVQVGTAEAILANPATPYVARFVEHIDVASVLKVGTLLAPPRFVLRPSDDAAATADRMEAAGHRSALVADTAGRLLGRADLAALRRVPPGGELGRAVQPCARVPASASVKQALPVVAAEAEPVAVVDDDGMLRGTIDRVGVVNALARRSHPATLEPAAP